ncbi:glycosyltransferase family 9 protein [Patescibacteria group bacterium]|nr:glycosyltransferase family 9 protein [Patescibacteria group bacterium]
MHRLTTLLVSALCLGYAPFRGRATRRIIDPARIGVVQLAKLGDMVCTTPMFAAVKRRYPDARVSVFGNSINKQVLDGLPTVDEYCVWQPNIFRMASEMRRRHLDFLCVTGPSMEALAAAYLAGVPCIAVPIVSGGYTPYETRPYKLLRLLALCVPHRMGNYAPREYLRLLEPIGIITDDTTKQVVYSDTARRTVDAFLRSNRLVEKRFAVMSPSAGNKIKNWPADRFARVAEYLASRGLPVVVIGGPRDIEEVAAMMSALEASEGVIDAGDRLSIDELKALVARAVLFVSADTGPIYIAESFGVTTVDIVGPVDEREQPPIGPHHAVVVAPRARPALSLMNARRYDAREARRQVEAITVPMVIQAIEAVAPVGFENRDRAG